VFVSPAKGLTFVPSPINPSCAVSTIGTASERSIAVLVQQKARYLGHSNQSALRDPNETLPRRQRPSRPAADVATCPAA